MKIKTHTRRLARKYPFPLVTVLVAALALLLLQPSGAVAGTIIFHDLTESPTVEFIGDAAFLARASGSCSVGANGVEGCGVTVTNPIGVAGPPTGASDVNILDPGVPSTEGVSDLIKFVVFGVPLTTGVAHFNFISDSEVLLPALLPGSSIPGVGGPIEITEDGTLQFATSFTWADGTVDSVFFESDIEPVVPPVPGPATLLLLGSGLVGVALWGRRRLGRQVNG